MPILYVMFSELYALPAKPSGTCRGCRPMKGGLIGAPKTLVRQGRGWHPHPTEPGPEVHVWGSLWHMVLPGRLVQVVVRRDPTARPQELGQKKPPPPVEAFFTTDLALSVEEVLQRYRDRWAIAIEIRDANAFDGLGHVQQRKVRRIIGASTFRLVMAATRTLWFFEQANQAGTINLRRSRPWYRHKCAPNQLDIVWACREALLEAGIFPIRRIHPSSHRKSQGVRKCSAFSDMGRETNG